VFIYLFPTKNTEMVRRNSGMIDELVPQISLILKIFCPLANIFLKKPKIFLVGNFQR